MSIELYRICKNLIKKASKIRYNNRILVDDNEIKDSFLYKLNEKINQIENKKWENIKNTILETAEEERGIIKTQKNIEIFDPEVEQLSNRSSKLREVIYNTDDVSINQKLRKERNQITKRIKTKLRRIHEKQIDKIVEEIETTKDDNRMFAAVKLLKSNRKFNTFVYDKEKKRITNKKEIHNIICEYFSSKFYSEEVDEIENYDRRYENKPLNNSITGEEVDKYVSKMKNNKASGYDNISVEMVKYGKIGNIISEVLNNVLEQKDKVDLGKSILNTIPKPKKEIGPVKNLRPINLLITLRKILSNITLGRIKEKVNKYLSKS